MGPLVEQGLSPRSEADRRVSLGALGEGFLREVGLELRPKYE